MNPDIRRARRAFVVVGVVVPLTISVLSSLVVVLWMPQLPHPVATHWSGDGPPDGFGPVWVYLVTALGLPVAVIAMFTVIALFAHRLPPRAPDGPQWSATARFLGAASLGTSTMIAFLSLVSVGVQRGLADAAEAPDITGWMFAGFGLALALGVAGWFLQPAVPVTVATPAGEVTGLALAPGERAVWVSSAGTARVGVIVLSALVAVMVVLTVVFLALEVPAWWIMAITTALLVVAMLTMLAFRVRVSADGLLVRSMAGWPRFRIPLEAIQSVRVTTVHPFAEFGGWGVRLATDGRFGVVLRTGEALEITRTSGRRFVVTVDDAQTGAALLTTLRADAASSSRQKPE